MICPTCNKTHNNTMGLESMEVMAYRRKCYECVLLDIGYVPLDTWNKTEYRNARDNGKRST